MRWLYATPSSATGRDRLATAYRRSLGLMRLGSRRSLWRLRAATRGRVRAAQEVTGKGVERRIA